jgi:hypothetical protein
MTLEEILARDWAMLVGREHGPLAFRLVVQPLVAATLAVRAGLRDAREGRHAYGWALATRAAERRSLLREGWGDVGRLFIVAVVIDVIYQLMVFRTVYPVQSLIIAAALAFPSYVIMRGLTNRIAGSLGRGGPM